MILKDDKQYAQGKATRNFQFKNQILSHPKAKISKHTESIQYTKPQDTKNTLQDQLKVTFEKSSTSNKVDKKAQL